MKIFNAQQIRQWDQYTIQNEGIASIDLMERAAHKCVDWIVAHKTGSKAIYIFCGKGNNGGDGLAIARLLHEQGIPVKVFILEFGKKGSEDFQANLQRLHKLAVDIIFIQSAEHFPEIKNDGIVIDALFGSGLNKPLTDLSADLVKHINQSGAEIISIDLPSGMFIDQSSKGSEIIKADHTLTFQHYKLGLLVAENAPFFGNVHLLDIGLHKDFLETEESHTLLVEKELIQTIYKPRNNFAHKGTYGHALIIGGSYGKVGAVAMAASSCLRSGAGLTTAYIPKCGYNILQTLLPEVMVMTDHDENMITQLPEHLEKYAAIGVGPGLGTEDATQKMVSFIIRRSTQPLVIDADGLNCICLQQELLKNFPANSILTPHPKEFDRLFGESNSDFERFQKAQQQAHELNIIIVLKGHHTFIAMPGGYGYFNNTGNAGMAKGGSGDVLTGIITALVAQGYDPTHAAILGVYLHGLAGDCAAAELGMEAMTATDIIANLSKAFLQIGQ